MYFGLDEGGAVSTSFGILIENWQKWYVGHCIEQRLHPKLVEMACGSLAEMVCGSLCRTESAIFGLSSKLVYQNEPCLIEFGFQNVPVLVQKHTSSVVNGFY